MSPTNRSLLMTCVLLLALFLSLGLLTTLPAQAQESPPATSGDLVPLPEDCSGITPGDQTPVCCAFGYVLVDEEPVEGALITISSASGSLTVATSLSSDPDYPEPFYATSLSDTLAVEAGDSVTFTVTYDGFTVTRVHQAQAGSQQVDLVIDTFEAGHFEQTDFVSETVILAHGSTENVRIDDIGGAQYIPILAVDRDRNKLYAAWTNDYNGQYQLYFSSSNDGGQTWSQSQQLHPNPIRLQVLHGLVVGSDGTLYMAWSEGLWLNSFDIYFSNSIDGGQSWSSPVRVNDYKPDSQGGASLAIDGNNHLYMAWVDYRNEQFDIYFAQSADGGKNWSDNIKVNDQNQSSTQELFNTPSLVVDSGGENVYIAWTDNRHDNPDIYLSKSNNGGETFEPNIRLNDNELNSQRNPRLAIDDDGALVAVWADERSGSSRIYFGKSTDHGLTWDQMTINDHAFITEQKDPNVVIDGNGQIYAAWHEPQPCRNNPNLDCSELILARSTDNGTSWYPIVHPSEQEQTVALPAFTNLAMPALAVDSNEQLIMAWQDNRENYSNLYSARWPDLTQRYTQGTYISRLGSYNDAGEAVGWQAFDWAAMLPAEGAITFEVRTANTVDNWSDWQTFSTSPADLSGLPHGQYLQWRAHLSSAISTTTPSLEAVHLTVHSPAVTPEIQTSPESVLHFNAEEGGDNPAVQLLEVMNGGTGSFNWTATTDVEWLTLSALSGTAPATIEVGTDSSELAPGTYFGEITLTAPGVPNSPHTVHVRLTVVPEGMSSWTMMFYLAGDNDLAFALKNKPLALQAAAQHANLNILVLLDGMGSDDTRLYHVLPDELRTFSPDDLPWLADEMDMGNPETLRDFVSWGLDNYAADFSYLNIANHGKGIRGIAWDSQADPDTFISVSELSQALKAATNTADDDPDNDRRLDLLHYDACLMAMLEGAYDVSGAANYLVASQNLGWSLFAFTDYAQAAAQASAPLDLASQMAQIYHERLAADSYPHTISAVDLLQVENVNQQLNGFITLLDSSLITHTLAISEARLETQKFDSRDYFVIDNQDEYLDLYHFVEHLQQRLPEPAIQSSALALMESISQTVMVEHHLSDEAYGSYWDLEEAHGLSIYFPSAPGGEGSLYEEYVEGDLFTFSEHSQYDEFLASVLSGVTPDDSDDDDVPPVGEYSPYAIHKTAPASAEAGAPITYTLTITNSSPLTATTLLITDTLPPGATYLSGGTLEGNIVSWLVPSLVPSDTISVQFAVSASQTITNSDYGVMTDVGFYAGTRAVVTTISSGLAGNCNGDGVVDAGDISAVILDILSGIFGNPGCDANQDSGVDAGDLSCTILLIFEGVGACENE